MGNQSRKQQPSQPAEESTAKWTPLKARSGPYRTKPVKKLKGNLRYSSNTNPEKSLSKCSPAPQTEPTPLDTTSLLWLLPEVHWPQERLIKSQEQPGPGLYIKLVPMLDCLHILAQPCTTKKDDKQCVSRANTVFLWPIPLSENKRNERHKVTWTQTGLRSKSALKPGKPVRHGQPRENWRWH